mmetsp:Transcript_132379/g.257926  ORF Transcript_132379/g.257926 Transcript_132379/m.257926 type:complete len:82 (-) Transcript_132379:1688-1933(-)
MELKCRPPQATCCLCPKRTPLQNIFHRKGFTGADPLGSALGELLKLAAAVQSVLPVHLALKESTWCKVHVNSAKAPWEFRA